MRSLDAAARVRDDHGQSLVEVALLLPLLLFIVLGLIDLSRAYAVKTAATSAAREAAIYAARDPQATAQQICARAMTELANGTTASPCALDPINPLVADEVWRSARPAATVVCNRVGDGTLRPCGHDTGAPRLFQTNGYAGSTVTVTVTTQVQLVSTYLVGRAFGLGSLVVGGAATFGGLAQ
jgi:Flp pilus assembly protein TadG